MLEDFRTRYERLARAARAQKAQGLPDTDVPEA